MNNIEQGTLLQALIDSIPDLIFYKDKQSVYIGCNKAFAGFVGTSSPNIIGKTDLDLFPKDVAEFFREKDREMLASGSARRNEEWVDFPDGSKVLLDTLKTPYISDDGTQLGLIGVSRDITERYRNESRLNELAAYGENNPAPVLRVDQEGKIIDLNPAAIELFSKQVIGKPVHSLPGLNDLTIENYIRGDLQVIRTGEINGSVYQWVVKGISALGVAHVYGSNITELKWMQEHIHNSSEDVRRILDTNPVPTIVTRLSDGTLLYSNVATASMMNANLADLTGQKTPDYFVHPEERALLMKELSGTGAIDKRDLHLKKMDGSSFWVSVSLRLMEFNGAQCVIASFYDLSDVKAHEEALQASEKRYRDLVEVLPDALVMHQDGKVVYANTEAARVFGYEDVEQAVASKVPFTSHIHPDSLPLAIARVQALMTGKQVNETAHQILLRADGSQFDAEVRSALSSMHGHPAVLVSVRDVSERKRAERMAKLNNHVLASISENRPLNESLNLIAVSIEFIHSDLKATVLIKKGEQLFSAAGPSMHPAYNKAVNGLHIAAGNCTCGSAAFYAKRIVSENLITDPSWKDAQSLVIEHDLKACWSEPIIDSSGAVLGTFAMFPDKSRGPIDQEIESIETAAKLAALAIERANADAAVQKFSQAVEGAAEAIIISDRKDRIEYVNKAFTVITGYTAEEAIGSSTKMLKADSQDEAFYRDMFRHCYRGDTWQGRVLCKRKNGEFYTAQISAAGIRDRNGKLIQLTAVYEDMSAYEELEEQLRQSQKMEAVGTLVGGIAHDFNNMLAGMMGQLYLLRQDLEEMPASVQRIEAVENQGFRAAEIIGQLLTFARKGRVSFKPLPLTTLLKETMKLHHVMIPENIELDQQLHDDALMVNADAGMMQQVLLNLLSNARDAVEMNEDPRISVLLHTVPVNGDGEMQACLEVMDNGSGIEDGLLDRVCEPFFTTKDVGKGTGLGLSMVYGAVQSHGGEVEIESMIGKGTTVRVLLPLIESASRPTHVTRATVALEEQAQTILLADDEEMLRDVMAEALEKLGYDVLVASDGRQALKLFEEHGPAIQLAILDVVMPHMGGVELSKRIHQVSAELPIIFYTGYDQETLLNGGMNHDFCRTVRKPAMIEDLSEIISEMLQTH